MTANEAVKTTGGRTKGKAGKVLVIILVALAALVCVVLLGARLYFRLPVSGYYSASEKGFEIPGLSDGFVPQGLCYDEAADRFYITGYRSDGTASPIYAVDRASGERIKTVYLAGTSGEAFTGHAGGLSVHGDYVYVAAEGALAVFDLREIDSAEDGATVGCAGLFPVGDGNDTVGVAFTAVHDGEIIVGEFYREGNYPTAENHKMTTPAGDYNQALAVSYRFSDDADAVFGIDPAPTAVYSLPDQVQGMAFHDGKIYLSTSYGVASSYIYAYAMDELEETTIDLFGELLPLYFCDAGSMVQTAKIAPMSEEIVFVGGKMYTMCESASNKYIFGKFTSARWCYATDMDAMAD